MKKAVIFYLWGKRNAGDMAICLGAISLLHDLGYEITFISRFTDNQTEYGISRDYIKEYHHDVIVEPGLFSFERTDSNFKKLILYFRWILYFIFPIDDKRFESIISESDIVFLNGGNLLRGNSLIDYARLAALFYPFRTATRLNKQMIGLPQSTADTSNFGYKILQKNLKKFNTVFIRESKSYLQLKEKLSSIPFIKTSDLAFFIKDVPIAMDTFKAKYGSTFDEREKIIALVLRSTAIGDIRELDYLKKECIKDAIVKFVDEFKKGYKIIFIIQTKKDIEFTHYVKSQTSGGESMLVIEEYDPYIIREVYRHVQLVVAMRLHAAVLTMTANTPVIGYFNIEWGLKNPGIMDDVGMLWTTDGNELVEHGRQVVSRREEYVQKIKQFIDLEKHKISKRLTDINL